MVVNNELYSIQPMNGFFLNSFLIEYVYKQAFAYIQ